MKTYRSLMSGIVMMTISSAAFADSRINDIDESATKTNITVPCQIALGSTGNQPGTCLLLQDSSQWQPSAVSRGKR
jgi:hypothetical protein